MTGQKQMGASFQSGNYQQAASIADSLKQNDVYKAKDRVLYSLEMGTIQFFQNNYKKSIEEFTNAEEYIDQFFAKSASTGIKAFLTNDTQLNYDGEVYEDVYLNGFKSLAYLEMDDYLAAFVEARRIAQKLDQAESKYAGYANSMQESDTTDHEIEWNAGTSSIHDSPLSHYLASMLYAKSGAPDDARIELENLQSAIERHQALPNSQVEFVPAFKKVQNPDNFNVLLTAFCGKAPEKRSNNIKIEDINDSPGLKIAIPKLVMRPSKVARVEATIDEEKSVSMFIIEEMDKVAQETFQIKKPIIVARATLRGILKSAGEEAITDAAEDQDEDLGKVVGFLAENIREASEQADLRGWQTMPGKVYTNVIKLPPGEHEITFEYYSAEGQVIHSEKIPITITENERLEPLSSIYSN
ncbi:hypothetical protein [Fodinibius salinus]|nr:hypothetical protein [Fodinibius salinus]